MTPFGQTIGIPDMQLLGKYTRWCMLGANYDMRVSLEFPPMTRTKIHVKESMLIHSNTPGNYIEYDDSLAECTRRLVLAFA